VISWLPVTRDDLKAAAASAGFDTVFPLLVRRLIVETAQDLASLDMPGGSGTAAGGFDGVVTTGRASGFVPEGTSVWELSVGGGQAKAEDDYSKRLDAPGDLTTREVTYVEALLVPWTKARAWTTEKNRDGRWREVHGYNLDRIHAWLDQAPATAVWLAGQLGKALPGVRSLGAWWTDTWLPSTRVALDESIVLAGREKAAEDLVAELKTGVRWSRWVVAFRPMRPSHLSQLHWSGESRSTRVPQGFGPCSSQMPRVSRNSWPNHSP
jgi:hypothetical protein